MAAEQSDKLDPGTLAVLVSKMDAIIREMTETMLLTARNPLLYAVKDFSCSIQTGDVRIVAQVDALPNQTAAGDVALRPIAELFAGDIHPGDCFINNSPYHGNSHVGDFSMAIPVFYEEELVFWVLNRAHQMDVGAYIPTSGSPHFKDTFEEGLQIPPLRVQKNYKDIKDIIRFFEHNIRYPHLWYGDYLAQVGSLRVGEKRLKEVCDKYGIDVVKRFLEEYIDYADRRAADEIRKLPKGTWEADNVTDPFLPFSPNGVRVHVKMTIDPDEELITFDTTQSDDQVEGGINAPQATTIAALTTGVLQVLDPSLPRNHGTLKHFKTILREGSVAGIPKWPASTSLGTTLIPDRLTNTVYRLFAEAVPSLAHAEGGYENGDVVFVTGTDFRKNNQPYTTVPFFSISGGPPSWGYDGWPMWFGSCVSGAMKLESVEGHELRFPHLFKLVEIDTDSAGAGEWRGGVSTWRVMQPRKTRLTMFSGSDGNKNVPQGVLGGKPGRDGKQWLQNADTGTNVRLLPMSLFGEICEENQEWHLFANGGAGLGDPLKRDPKLVQRDARNEYISLRAARDVYGVVLDTEAESYAVDLEATENLRRQLRQNRGRLTK